MNNILNKIIKRIKSLCYCSAALDWTAERSYGNFDDCFADGYEKGYAQAIIDVKEIFLDEGIE